MAARKNRMPSFLKNAGVLDRTAAEQREAEAEDREARKRGRYYKGLARRIRHGLVGAEEIAMLRADKQRVASMRDSV